VRHRHDLISALTITPSYLLNPSAISGQVTDYRDWQIPLGRRFRALKIWFTLRSYGVSGLQHHIRRTIKLGDFFADLIKSRSDLFHIITGPSFALTVISVVPPQKSEQQKLVNGEVNDFIPDAEQQHREEANAVTKRVYEAVNARGEVLLTSGVIAGTYAIRVVSANQNAEEKWVRRAFELLVEEAEKTHGKV